MTEHSYRRGGVLKACQSGLSVDEIQRHVGWKTAEMVHRYTDQTPCRNLAISRRIMAGPSAQIDPRESTTVTSVKVSVTPNLTHIKHQKQPLMKALPKSVS